MPEVPVSAGCLVTRQGPRGTEVLLVHASRASFRMPLFGIPKGLVEPGEDLVATAQRETEEETGLRVRIHGELGSVRQKSGKIVYAFLASVAPESEAAIDERGRCRQHDAENDVCAFYPLAEARELMIEAQREFLHRLSAARREDVHHQEHQGHQQEEKKNKKRMGRRTINGNDG